MSKNEDPKMPNRILQFACDCVSKLHNTIRDPWSYVSRAGLISSETKEIILNKTYRKPKTVTQLAKEIGLSQPAIHKHVKELLASDMMKAAKISETDKTYRVEQYFEPNFPVMLKEDQAELETACKNAASSIAEIYWKKREELETAFNKTTLAERGHEFTDILDYLYSKIRRIARDELEVQGFFPELPTHKDGSRWVYWAEEIEEEKS